MKLTPELLLKLGFKHAPGKEHRHPDGVYNYNPDKYIWTLQVSIGDYPETNPNSGIVSIYNAAGTYQSWDGNDNPIDVEFPELEVPIAVSVTTLERLNAIYVALTQNPAFVV